MNLFDFIDKQLLNEHIKNGYISVTVHRHAGLLIYNYTRFAQIDHKWDHVTHNCRGLITDLSGEIIARPFSKFFNIEELDPSMIPSDEFEVYEKLDGSLGILYWIDDIPFIATRGSFESNQAIHATKIIQNLNDKHDLAHKLNRNHTYLFEIIYPENHIVVNYGNTDDIFLLAEINNETNEEYNIDDWKDIFSVVKRYDGIKDFNTIRNEFDGENKEGFVVRFKHSGFRMKMKFENYFKIHAALCHINERRIVEALADNDNEFFDNIMHNLDEENKLFVTNTIDRFTQWYNNIEQECLNTKVDYDSDKEAAKHFKNEKYSGILFAIRHGKDYRSLIWNIIKKERKIKNGNE